MTEQLPPKVKKSRLKRITRDGVLFVAGLLGVFHETLIQNVERPALLVLFAGMMGFPVFLNKDDKNQGDGTP